MLGLLGQGTTLGGGDTQRLTRVLSPVPYELPQRWVVSFWSPELRSFWLAQQIESSGWAQNQKSVNYAQAQKYELIMDTVETIVLAAHPGPSQNS